MATKKKGKVIAPSVMRRPDKVVLVQLRAKERDEKGKLQPAGSKAFSVTDISLEDLYQRFMSVLEK
jgi:hypothetical protein